MNYTGARDHHLSGQTLFLCNCGYAHNFALVVVLLLSRQSGSRYPKFPCWAAWTISGEVLRSIQRIIFYYQQILLPCNVLGRVDPSYPSRSCSFLCYLPSCSRGVFIDLILQPVPRFPFICSQTIQAARPFIWWAKLCKRHTSFIVQDFPSESVSQL